MKKLLEEFALAIREHLKINGNFEVKAIIEDIGGIIKYDSFVSEFEPLLIKRGEKFTLFVRPTLSSERENYILLLKLSEMILYAGLLTYNELWINTDISKCKETQEARWLTEALLMPYPLFKKVLDDNVDANNLINTKNIAKYFNVPTSVARSRGVNLGYIKE